jgi:hypothetical protein
MIQRIQTLYLLIVFLIHGIMFFVPIGNINDYVLNITHFGNKDEIILVPNMLLVFNSLILLNTIYGIFMFKKRKMQLLSGKLNIIFISLMIIFISLYFDDGKLKLELTDAETSFKIGFILPLISVVLIILAGKAIKKDEDLIRSVDRIR